MHSTTYLKSSHFSFSLNDTTAFFEDVFPNFNPQDRVGIVVRQSGGALGASALLMAAVTRFYDFFRLQINKENSQLRVYPDFFVFHIGEAYLNHSLLDIWPAHKEVQVEDDPEQILSAVNDRGITRLIVEDTTSSPATFLRETVSSAEGRIVSALAFSSSGRVDNANLQVVSNSCTEDYVYRSIERSNKFPKKMREELINARESLLSDHRVVESYRQISLNEAFTILSPRSSYGPLTEQYFSAYPAHFFRTIKK